VPPTAQTYGESVNGEQAIGERLGEVRRRRGLTQEQLAERAGVSVSTIRKLEQRDRESASLPTLRKLAAALDVTTVELFSPTPRLDEPVTGAADRDDLYTIRRALQPPRAWTGEVITLADDDEPPTIDAVRESVIEVNGLFRDSEYGAAVAALPTAIAHARRATTTLDGDDQALAKGQLAQAYQTAGLVLIQTRRYDLAYHALGLALDAAHAADDRVLAASVVCSENWLLTRQGRFDEAERAATITAEAIEPSFMRSSPRHFAVWGWLNLGAAAAATRNNRTDAATEALRRARAAAQVAAGGSAAPEVQHWSRFDPAVVAMREVELSTVTGHVDQALSVAQTVPINARPRVTWQRHRLDVAAAHVERRQYDEAYGVLAALRSSAPGWLRHQRYARHVTRQLITARARTVPAELRGLADFLQVES
jgi:transcriptional regulator with XRE-family HTH domain/DNA-directed RNA polymerase subunit K/omega